MPWYNPFLHVFFSRFVAGKTLEEAITYGKMVKRNGIFPIFDVLGENTHSIKGAEKASATYARVLDEMKRTRLQGAISLKLSSFDLDEDEEACYRMVSHLAEKASENDSMVWIDMEDSAYTSKTIRLYRRLVEHHENVGICIQVYLKRARRDILSLLPDQPKIRLVKGVYPEKGDKVYRSHREINQNFKKLLDIMSQKDAWTAVGSHDMEIIAHALTLPFPNHLEFQLLKGVRDDEKKILARHGYAVGEYIPFGKEWEKYVVRRLLERARNIIWIILSALRLDS